MTITHVCLSDLHFGAETSLLTKVDKVDSAEGSRFAADYRRPSEVLEALVSPLRSILRKLAPDSPPPTLILAGDVLELALSRMNEASMAFETFLDAVFPGGAGDLFSRDILYVPGNHDHHLWELTREAVYLKRLRSLPADAPLNEELHVTSLFNDLRELPTQGLLSKIAHRNEQRRNLTFAVAYPNYAIEAGGDDRVAIFTHGHFVEPLYTAMSELKRYVFPEQPIESTAASFEEENFAWIDFFWSTMGRSGTVGKDTQRVYEMLVTDKGLNDLSGRVASGIVKAFLSKDWIPDTIEKVVISRFVEQLIQRFSQRERADSGMTLSESAMSGLCRYVSGPLCKQLRDERGASAADKRVSVVFGHTHKPDRWVKRIGGFRHEVEIFNTGGWVVDTVKRQTTHGAAIVLVSDRCEVASLRLYNEKASETEGTCGTLDPVSVSGGSPGFRTAIADAVQKCRADWDQFSAHVENAITIRATALALRSV
jgi:hypothetical protein